MQSSAQPGGPAPRPAVIYPLILLAAYHAGGTWPHLAAGTTLYLHEGGLNLNMLFWSVFPVALLSGTLGLWRGESWGWSCAVASLTFGFAWAMLGSVVSFPELRFYLPDVLWATLGLASVGHAVALLRSRLWAVATGGVLVVVAAIGRGPLEGELRPVFESSPLALAGLGLHLASLVWLCLIWRRLTPRAH